MDDPFNPHPETAKMLGETKSSIMPKDLPDELTPEFREKYPTPWRIGPWRGNGHCDIFAANGEYVAHIYCWDFPEDEDLMVAKVKRINGE